MKPTTATSLASRDGLQSIDVSTVFSFRPKPVDQKRLLTVMDALKNQYGIPDPSRLDAIRLALRLAATQFAKAGALAEGTTQRVPDQAPSDLADAPPPHLAALDAPARYAQGSPDVH